MNGIEGGLEMRKKAIALLLVTMMSFTGCGISQSDYDAALQEKESLQSQLNTLNNEYSALQTDYDTLLSEKDNVQSEFDAYKEKMKPYEVMELAEAEARTAEAQQKQKEIEEEEARKKAEEEAEAKKKAEEEAKKKAEEEAKGYETGITYSNLARNPEDYKGKKIKFKGEVVQVIEGDDTVQIRLAVNNDYDDILFCEYDSSIVSSRVLEDDKITIYGVSVGTITYESTMGGQITIPAAYIEKIDQ